jgi:hypothetical protein
VKVIAKRVTSVDAEEDLFTHFCLRGAGSVACSNILLQNWKRHQAVVFFLRT